MAYDKIIPIHSRLDHCMDYVLNHEKTDMAAVLAYIGQEGKNTVPDSGSALETAINCELESACQDMQETKRRWEKTGGVLGYHLIHAFAPGEVTPEQAHEIGVEFATRLLGDRYEAVISTHLDREHLHCHILFNSVSFVDGAKYKNTFRDYFGDIRGISNEISRGHGLSVIEPDGKGRQYSEWHAQQNGKPTIREGIRQEVDAILQKSYTYKTFLRELERRGYVVKTAPQVKHTAIRPPGSGRFIRLDSLGKGYTEADLKARLEGIRSGKVQPTAPRRPPLRPYLPPGRRYRVRGSLSRCKPKKLTGFQALCFKYLYLLREIKRGRPRIKRPAFVMRQEVIKFDRYQRQFRYLHENRIETADQLAMQYDAVQAEIDALTKRRSDLYRRKRQGEDTGAEIDAITQALRPLRRELRLCAQIEGDIPAINEAVRREAEQKRKAHEKADKRRSDRDIAPDPGLPSRSQRKCGFGHSKVGTDGRRQLSLSGTA